MFIAIAELHLEHLGPSQKGTTTSKVEVQQRGGSEVFKRKWEVNVLRLNVLLCQRLLCPGAKSPTTQAALFKR